MVLDGILTVVDSKHIIGQLQEEPPMPWCCRQLHSRNTSRPGTGQARRGGE